MENKDFNLKGISAYHGTSHKLEKFDNLHLGNGIGAHDRGYGFYFTSKDAIARYYAKEIGKFYKHTTDMFVYKVRIHGNKTIEQFDFIQWDKPLTDLQRDKISGQFLKEYGEEIYNTHYPNGSKMIWMGGPAFTYLAQKIGESINKLLNYQYANSPEYKKAASELLLRAGIDGIEYPPDQLPGVDTQDGRNYVVFDPSAIEIEGVENL